MIVIGGSEVTRLLPYKSAIGVLRGAMTALSNGTSLQLLRSVVTLDDERIFAIMPGALTRAGYFGAKLISVFPDPEREGRATHRGIVALFDGEKGIPLCVVDGEAITLIRTASASAVATDFLARPESSLLAILGCGVQAEAHVSAISLIRDLRAVVIWGRSRDNANSLAERIAVSTGLPTAVAADVESAVRSADIVCTVTSSREPILKGCWVGAGTHVNLVGASGPRSAEADSELLRRGRYFVDSRKAALLHAGEFLRAKSDGVIDDRHILGEIGQVIMGQCPSRLSADDITIYKSLGHAVQDIASAAYVYEKFTTPM